jgi:hypothetical protein
MDRSEMKSTKSNGTKRNGPSYTSYEGGKRTTNKVSKRRTKHNVTKRNVPTQKKYRPE